MKKSLTALAFIGTLCAMPTYAQANPAVSVSAGTPGFGLHLVMPYDARLNFRVGVNAYDHSSTGKTDSASYSLSAKLRTVDALVDYFPGAGGFRLTGGLIYNGNRGDMMARPNGSSYTFQGNTYPVSTAGNVRGDVDFNKVAPYLGIGVGNAVAKDKGWGFTADLGVMFQGTPNVNLTSTDCTAGAAICSQLARDLAAENAEWREKAKDYRYYPVVRIGLSYKF